LLDRLDIFSDCYIETFVTFWSHFQGIIICEVNAYSKRWIWSTDWNDPKNWDKEKLPCGQDDIQVSEGVLYFRKNISVNSLTLPANGEIVFGDSAGITFSSDRKTSVDTKNCAAKGEVVKFIGSQPKEWFNPLNWNIIENGQVANWSKGSLYMDRIPCKTDQVSFPQGDAFLVSVKGKAEISELVISKSSVTNVQSYLGSNAGKLRFKISSGSSLTASGKMCNQQFGCPCGYASMKDTICGLFECPPACENKVKPEGDCCERCGSLIKFNLNPRFSLTTCQNNLQRNLATTNFKAATLVISPILERNAVERAQILLTDQTNGRDALGAAKATLSYLESGRDEACSVFNAKIDTSNGGNGGSTKKSTGGSEDSSSIALAVTLTLVVVLVILAAAYLVYRRRKGLSFGKRQVLHNEMAISGSHTVEMTDTAFSGAAVQYDTDLEGVPGKFGESFENPLYNDVVQPGPAVIDPQQLSDTIEPVTAKPLPLKKEKKSEKSFFSKAKLRYKKKEEDDAFENPVYSEFANDSKQQVFDPDDNFAVPEDVGYQNPLYGDLYDQGEGKDVEEVPSNLPPSFLDTIGFSPDDVDDAMNSANGIAGADLDAGKGESEA